MEYENEVEEESARVKALLEKLRIDAEVLVFWLASGRLNTYELIINGKSNDIDSEIIVNDALKDEEWWDDLQMFRGQLDNMTSSQELTHLTHIIESTTGRPGIYNPHEELGSERRRLSMADISVMSRKPDIGTLSKLGVSVGIHTHHLNDEVFRESTSDDEWETDSSSSEVDSDIESISSEPNRHQDDDYVDASKRPLLGPFNRDPSRGPVKAVSENTLLRLGRDRKSKTIESNAPGLTSYGTMSASQTLTDSQAATVMSASQQAPGAVQSNVARLHAESTGGTGKDQERYENQAASNLQPPGQIRLLHNAARRSQSTSPTRQPEQRALPEGPAASARPNMSRQSSTVRFSSRPVPAMTIATEDGNSKIGFVTSSNPVTPKVERPTFSRQSSQGRFSSRPVPETKVNVGDEGVRTISFAEQPVHNSNSAQHSRHHSRQGSSYSNFGQGDVSLSIPQLLESYKFDSRISEEDGGSGYSTQGVALSFNDLPSRAQHLILNELMRQHSQDTAVMLSTLPIPSEGTSLDDPSSVRYLSDIEVLCNELPPVLMVLSNNMTVTVSL